jgi:hypothetical protein
MLFVWEVDLLENLMRTFNLFYISNACVWKYDATGIFSVKSAYSVLMCNFGVRVASHAVFNQVLAKM